MEEKVVKQFTDEEVGKVKELQQRVLSINTQLGEVELSIYGLEETFERLKKQKQDLIQEYKKIQEEEDKLGQELRDKYGEGTYEISSNTFTPAQ